MPVTYSFAWSSRVVTVADPIRIANCSGFYGDRPSGALEMVEGGPIDVLTGDWLAELTMLILARSRAKNPGTGYARTFVDQMEQVMGSCLDRGIKVVSNAGGLDPAACAERVSEVASQLGLNPSIAYIDGDDVLDRLDLLQPFGDDKMADSGSLITANAYFGCWGIVEALSLGADIVITGRVTDAALACGPAAWHHSWQRDDFDQLAGAVVAGHVIECSAQATGGNYSFFDEIADHLDKPRFGFPWAEIAEDGSSVIGKHDGTGGAVTIGTVTSQLLYEVQGAQYQGPDVTARFDTIHIEQAEADRVHLSGVKGEPPPSTLKVGANALGGYRNTAEVALTGLDIEEKARLVEATFLNALPHRADEFESFETEVMRTDKLDAHSNEEATAFFRVTVKDPDEQKVGRSFSNAVVQTALSSIPGLYSPGTGPTGAQPFGVFRAALISAAAAPQAVHIGGVRHEVSSVVDSDTFVVAVPDSPRSTFERGEFEMAPLGRVAGTRSGDKGGDANLGVFVRSDEAFPWLDSYLTVDRLRGLLPETAELKIDRYRFANLRALNFVLHGLLDQGVAASSRQDRQAKSLGEWLRSRIVEIPSNLVG